MVNIHFLEEIVQQYSDKKIIEQNLKNSIKGLKEFKCKGNCSEGKIRTPRVGGRYFIKTYNLISNNCVVYVEAQFKGTSKEFRSKIGGFLASNLRDYAISYVRNSSAGMIGVTRSDKMRYYDYNGSKGIIEKNIKNMNSHKLKKEIESYE